MDDNAMKSNLAQDETLVSGEPAPTDPNKRKLGFLLDEEDPLKVCKRVTKDRERQQPTLGRLRAIWKRTQLWRDGQRHVDLNRDEDQWETTVPLGMADAPPMPNKCDRIVRRVANVIWADEPVPECEPSSEDASDRDAAETATRVLKVETGEAGLNFPQLVIAAADKAGTFASSFAYFYVDPTGGGQRPKEVIAHKAQLTFQSIEQVLTDPATGQKGDEKDFVSKFIMPADENGNQQLTDDETQAEMQWLPQVDYELLTGNHVLLLPETARDIAKARGVHITLVRELGDLRAQFPEKFKTIEEDAVRKLVDWRPTGFKELVPEHVSLAKREDDEGKPSDQALVVVQLEIYRSCSEYPRGAYVCVAGENTLLHREEWTRTITLANGKKKLEHLILPVAQCRQLNDNSKDNPYGIALGAKVGVLDEIRASIYEFAVDHLWKHANPLYFLPDGSIVQPKQLLARDGEPVYTNPQGKPEWERLPEFPAVGKDLLEAMTSEENDESSLQETAQGTEVSSVTSGIQARTIVEEAQKGLAQIRGNALNFYMRCCRITLQQIRVFYTSERIAKFSGENGKFKVKGFTGSDLGSTVDVKIARGSATMMSPALKRQLALEERETGMIDDREFKRISASALNPILGLQDDPYLLKIADELSVWADGASAVPGAEQAIEALRTWQTTQQQAVEVAVAAGADPAAATMAPPPPIPSPFRRIPVDYEPEIAALRHSEIARVMSGDRFKRFELEWQQVLVAEYNEMKMYAGVTTLIEQAEMAQNAVATETAQADADRASGEKKEKIKAAAKDPKAPKRARKPAVAQPAGAPSGAPK